MRPCPACGSTEEAALNSILAHLHLRTARVELIHAEPFVPHKKVCVFFKKETKQRGFIFVRKYNSFSKANISPLFVFARGTQETKNWIWNSGQIQRTQGLSIPVGSNPHESRHDRIKGNAPFAPLLESFIYLFWVLVATRCLRIIAKRST